MADFNEYKGVWVFCEQRQGALMSTDFELVSEARKLADELGCEVTGLLLGDNVEGFAPAKQLAKEDGTTAKAGETLEFKVVEFSKATKRIILSHSRLNEEIKRAEVQAERAEKKRSDDATKDSVKKLNASVEKTTLGDISGLAELKAQMEAAAEKPKKAAAKKSAKAEEASTETEE